MVNKKLLDVYYEILSHYLHFPEVDDTLKSINDGLNLWYNYPQNDFEFREKQADIIAYIQKARFDNIIYKCQTGIQVFIPVEVSGKTLMQDDRNELLVQLENEIFAQALKGIHQVIKRHYPALNDNLLSEELLSSSENALQKYNLQY